MFSPPGVEAVRLGDPAAGDAATMATTEGEPGGETTVPAVP
jgi:hypothetical protein